MSQKKGTGKTREYNPSGRRWWLKLQFAFFSDKRVRALRRKHGDLALIIYQKIMLKSLENDSSMRFEGLEETFEDEIAVDIMEDNGDCVQLIREIMDFLIQHRLMVEQEDKSYFFPQAAEMSGDESSAAERVRRMRARNREALQDNDACNDVSSQSDAEPLHCNDSSSQSNKALQCYDDALHCYQIQNQNNRIDRSRAKSRIDLDLELELKQKTETETEKTDSASVSAERDASAAADAAAPPAVDLFSLSDLFAIRRKHEINLNTGGLCAFLDEMQASGWMLYKKPVTKDGIVKALRGWAKFNKNFHRGAMEEKQPFVPETPQITRPSGEAVKDEIEAEIWEIAYEYISQKRFDENNGGHRSQIGKFCPRSAFTQEQLDYLLDWGIYPKSEQFIEVDEYLEDEE